MSKSIQVLVGKMGVAFSNVSSNLVVDKVMLTSSKGPIAKGKLVFTQLFNDYQGAYFFVRIQAKASQLVLQEC